MKGKKMNMQPKELYISPAGGSGNIGMSTFLACPQKAKLYLDGWRRKKVTHPIGVGILEHKALFDPRIKEDENRQPEEIFEDLYMKGKVPPYEKIDGTKVKEIEIDFTDKKGMQINKAQKMKAGKLVANLANKEVKKMESIGFEQQMCVAILDPNSGREVPELDGFFLCGRKDIQNKDNITDFKTSQKTLTDDDIMAGPYHYQLSAYRYMTIIEKRTDFRNLQILNTVMKKEPESKIIKYTGKDEDLLMVYQTFLWVARQVKEFFRTNYWPRNPASCKQWGICDFHPICWGEKYSRPDIEIKDKLYHRGY